MISSHSLFWLKSYEDLHGKIGSRLNFFVSLLTILWRNYLSWLEQSQNSMELWRFLPKNFLSFLEIDYIWIWYGWMEESNIFLATCMESVITTMYLMLVSWVVWFKLYLITNNSASVEVMLMAWWIVLTTEVLWTWIWAMDIATWFLMFGSNTTTAVLGSTNI